MRGIFLCLLVMGLLVGCGGGGGSGGDGSPAEVLPIAPSEVSFTSFHGQASRVSASYPSDWSVNTADPDLVGIFYEPQEDDKDRFAETIILYRFPITEGGSPTEEEGVENIVEISSRRVTIDGFDGWEVIFDADIEGIDDLDFRFMETFVQIDNEVVGTLYAAERHKFPKNQEIVRHLSQQMRFGQIVLRDLELNSDLSEPGRPEVASDGENFLVVSCRPPDFSNERIWRIVGTLYQSDKRVLSEFEIDSIDSYYDCDGLDYHLVFDGEQYLLTYNVEFQLVGRRIAVDGTMLDSDPIHISRTGPNALPRRSDLTVGAGGVLSVWVESSDLNGHTVHSIWGAKIFSDGSVSERLLLSESPISYFGSNAVSLIPHVVGGGDGYLAVWTPYFFYDAADDIARPIYGRALGLSGDPISSSDVKFHDDNGDTPRYVQLAYDGQDYLLSWIEGALVDGLIGAGESAIFAKKVLVSGELKVGDAEDPGITIVPHVVIDGDDQTKEFLKLSYHNGQYRFFWSVPFSSKPLAGVYGVEASKDLNVVSSASRVNGDSRQQRVSDRTTTYEVNAANSNNLSIVLWASGDGVIELWRLSEDYFEE